jgi:hypothetical protein
VWAATNLYPKTVAGLLTCYSIGLLHFTRTLSGDLAFTAAMFATPVLLQWLARDNADPSAAA